MSTGFGNMSVLEGVGGSSFARVAATDTRLQRFEGKWDVRNWKQ